MCPQGALGPPMGLGAHRPWGLWALGPQGPRGRTVGGILSRSTIKIKFLIKSVFLNVVWGGFEVGFGISVKNNADP